MNALITDAPDWRPVLDAMLHPRRRPLSDQDALNLLDARQDWLDFDGQNLSTWHWGGSHGPHVLLVHGWESHSAHWHAWVPPLLAAGWRVSALDLPAHGHSSGSSTHVIQSGRAVLAVARQVGPLHAVIGHSMGSAAALYAFAHGLRVSASVHIAGPTSLRRVLRHAGHAAQLNEAGIQSLTRAFAQHHDLDLDDMELPALSRGFIHPALLHHAPEDPEVPLSESRQLLQAWPQAQLREAPGLGHRRILRDSGVIQGTLNWLHRVA